jgi:putative ABC transport system permease protein
LIGATVTADFFSVLRVQPLLGRGFLPEEDRRGGPRVVVLSHGFWQRRFGSDRNLLGQSLMLNGQDYTVVGIAPPHLRLPSGVDLWVPLAMDLAQTGRRADFLLVLARLKPGVNLDQARADMNTITARLQQQYPETNSGWRADLVPLQEQIVGDIRTTLLVLLAAVGFVLLIACANVANLLLARATARGKEIAIRIALGAGRGRVVQQLLTESVLLALLSGAVGVLLTLWGIDLLVRLGPQDIPRLSEITADNWVLGFAVLLSLLTGVLFGIAPALQGSRLDLNETLKEGGRSATSSLHQGRLRNSLVVVEVALSLMLLVGAGLMIKSLYRLVHLDAGFNRDNLLTMQLALPRAKYAEDHQVAAFYERLLERVRGLPGVTSATVVSPLPLSGGSNFLSFAVAGRPAPPPEEVVDASVLFVGDRYVETMGIPLLRGRTLTERDSQIDSQGMLINQALADRHFRNQDPIGQRLTFGDPQSADALWATIVGVIANVKHEVLENQVYPAIYVPSPGPGMSLVARTTGDPLHSAPALRDVIRALDRDLPVYNIRTMDQVLSVVLAQRRFSMLLLSIFAGLSLVLAVVGLYGVVAYSVSQRTHEIGIRMSLGARPHDILRLVVGQGMVLTLLGVGIGLVAALGLTRFLAGLLYDVKPTDPLTFGGVSALLAAVALLASFIPARRAAKVDPMVVLRYE